MKDNKSKLSLLVAALLTMGHSASFGRGRGIRTPDPPVMSRLL